MAREKVQDKYRAILDAAVVAFAERGFWDTPTSLISKTAGVADGTLFNYFKTKDDLINEVYIDIKRELAEAVLEDVDAYRSAKDIMWHIWSRHIAWCMQHPEKFKVFQQIDTFFEITDATKARAKEPFADFEQTVGQFHAGGMFQDYPKEYLGVMLDTQAVMTVRLAMLNPDKLAEYQKMGFDILWNGVTR